MLKGHWASSMQKGQRGCLRPVLYVLQTLLYVLLYVEEDHAKLRVSCLLDIASFPWKLLPLSYFKSSSYTYPSLPWLLCKKPRTIADPGTGLWAVDGFPLSSHLPLLPLPCNKQNYPVKKSFLPSETLTIREQELLLSLLMQEISKTASVRTQVCPWKAEPSPKP